MKKKYTLRAIIIPYFKKFMSKAIMIVLHDLWPQKEFDLDVWCKTSPPLHASYIPDVQTASPVVTAFKHKLAHKVS